MSPTPDDPQTFSGEPNKNRSMMVLSSTLDDSESSGVFESGAASSSAEQESVPEPVTNKAFKAPEQASCAKCQVCPGCGIASSSAGLSVGAEAEGYPQPTMWRCKNCLGSYSPTRVQLISIRASAQRESESSTHGMTHGFTQQVTAPWFYSNIMLRHIPTREIVRLQERNSLESGGYCGEVNGEKENQADLKAERTYSRLTLRDMKEQYRRFRPGNNSAQHLKALEVNMEAKIQQDMLCVRGEDDREAVECRARIKAESDLRSTLFRDILEVYPKESASDRAGEA